MNKENLQNSYQINQYKWTHKDLLGKGAFGTVYKCNNGKDYKLALKIMDFQKIQEDKVLKLLFQNECQALKILKGNYVVSASEIIEKTPNVFIITELCEGGDLRQYLTKQGKHLSEKESIQIIQDMIKGMQEMNKNGFCHRDLKPENTFIHQNIYKIADFGFCQKVSQDEKMDLYLGTPGYMSPQLVFQQPYTSKCDIWTLGVIFYELLFGNLPGKGRDEVEMIKYIQKNGIQYPFNIKTSFISRKFLQGCLQIDEDKRLTWEQVFSHPICNIKIEAFNQKTNDQSQNHIINPHNTQYITNHNIVNSQQIQSQNTGQTQSSSHQITISKNYKHDEIYNSHQNNLSNNHLLQNMNQQIHQKQSQNHEENQKHLDYMNIPIINLKLHEIQFMNSLQKYLKSHTEDLQVILKKYFPRNKINFKEFHFFCEKSNISEFEIQDIFCYFHRDPQGEIDIEEFQYRVLNTDYNKNDLNDILLKHKIKGVIKKIKNLVEQKHTNLILLFEQYHPGVGDMNFQQFSSFIQRVDNTLNQHEIELIFHHFDLKNHESISMDQFIMTIQGKHPELSNIDIKCIQKGIRLTPTSTYTLKTLQFIIHKFKLDLKTLYMQYDHSNQGHLNYNDFQVLIHFICQNIDDTHCREIFQFFCCKDGFIKMDAFIEILH